VKSSLFLCLLFSLRAFADKPPVPRTADGHPDLSGVWQGGTLSFAIGVENAKKAGQSAGRGHNAVGRSIKIGGDHTIVGVMPPDPSFGPIKVWRPWPPSFQVLVRVLPRRRQCRPHPKTMLKRMETQSTKSSTFPFTDIEVAFERTYSGIRCRNASHAPQCEQPAAGSRGQREHQALGQHQTDQARAARSQGPRITISRRRPFRRASKRFRCVSTRDQQHQTNRTEQDQQRGTNIADLVSLECPNGCANPASS
jgi:hypothetical protein